MPVDILTAIGIGGASGLSSGALLMFILRSLEKRVTSNSNDIKKLKKDMFIKFDEQEDCWEEEIRNVQKEINSVDGKMDRIITVMQMQATTAGHPEMVAILKGGK